MQYQNSVVIDIVVRMFQNTIIAPTQLIITSQENGSEGEAIDTRGMAPKNIDDRGRIRGGCVDCDCDEFERSPKGAQCHYCHCSPSAHEQLWPPPPEVIHIIVTIN